MEVVKMNELIRKRAHNGLAKSQAAEPAPVQDKRQAHTVSDGESDSMLERV